MRLSSAAATVLFLACSLTVFCICQPKSPAVQRAERLTKTMKDSLGLSKDQVKKVRQVNLDAAQKMQAIRQQASGPQDRRAVRERFQTVNAEKDSAIKAVLTEDQWASYLFQMEAFRERMREGRRGGPGGPVGGGWDRNRGQLQGGGGGD